MTRIVAVRHGETDWNREGRMQGWAPVPLNETGREQAKATGRWLDERYQFDRVYGSDLLRTRETADLLGDSIGELPTEFEPAWRERALGLYQGLTREDIEARFPEFGLNEAAYEAIEATPEGGESLRTVEARVTNRFEELANGSDEEILVVTHGGPLCILLGYVKGMSLTESLTDHHLDNCAIAEFEPGGDGMAVVAEDRSVPKQP